MGSKGRRRGRSSLGRKVADLGIPEVPEAGPSSGPDGFPPNGEDTEYCGTQHTRNGVRYYTALIYDGVLYRAGMNLRLTAPEDDWILKVEGFFERDGHPFCLGRWYYNRKMVMDDGIPASSISHKGMRYTQEELRRELFPTPDMEENEMVTVIGRCYVMNPEEWKKEYETSNFLYWAEKSYNPNCRKVTKLQPFSQWQPDKPETWEHLIDETERPLAENETSPAPQVDSHGTENAQGSTQVDQPDLQESSLSLSASPQVSRSPLDNGESTIEPSQTMPSSAVNLATPLAQRESEVDANALQGDPVGERVENEVEKLGLDSLGRLSNEDKDLQDRAEELLGHTQLVDDPVLATTPKSIKQPGHQKVLAKKRVRDHSGRATGSGRSGIFEEMELDPEFLKGYTGTRLSYDELEELEHKPTPPPPPPPPPSDTEFEREGKDFAKKFEKRALELSDQEPPRKQLRSLEIAYRMIDGIIPNIRRLERRRSEITKSDLETLFEASYQRAEEYYT